MCLPALAPPAARCVLREYECPFRSFSKELQADGLSRRKRIWYPRNSAQQTNSLDSGVSGCGGSGIFGASTTATGAAGAGSARASSSTTGYAANSTSSAGPGSASANRSGNASSPAANFVCGGS